jgi:hypothetical protein
MATSQPGPQSGRCHGFFPDVDAGGFGGAGVGFGGGGMFFRTAASPSDGEFL